MSRKGIVDYDVRRIRHRPKAVVSRDRYVLIHAVPVVHAGAARGSRARRRGDDERTPEGRVMAPRPEVRAALFAHEMMRRLGIEPDDIFLDTRVPGHFAVSVRVAGKEWVWVLGKLPMPAKDFLVEWSCGVEYWNAATDEQIEELGLDRSPQMAMAAAVVRSLIEKGIPIDPGKAKRLHEQRRRAAN